jgi:hypothetical protein
MEIVIVVIGAVIVLGLLSLVSDTAGDILEVGCVLVAAALGIGFLILLAKVFNAFG